MRNKSGSSCSDIKFNVETKIFAVLSCGPHIVDSEIKEKLCSVLSIKAESVHEWNYLCFAQIDKEWHL